MGHGADKLRRSWRAGQLWERPCQCRSMPWGGGISKGLRSQEPAVHILFLKSTPIHWTESLQKENLPQNTPSQSGRGGAFL